MFIVNGTITATLKNSKILVEDKEAGHRYSVDAGEIGTNELGNEASLTWRQAIKSNCLIIQNDDLDGHSWGQHGSIFVREKHVTPGHRDGPTKGESYMISVEKAATLAGGQEKITRAWMIPIARLLAASEDGQVDEQKFLTTLEQCLGVAARNVAMNQIRNEADMNAAAEKNTQKEQGKNDDGHHHFAP